jgi:hypothetical protein
LRGVLLVSSLTRSSRLWLADDMFYASLLPSPINIASRVYVRARCALPTAELDTSTSYPSRLLKATCPAAGWTLAVTTINVTATPRPFPPTLNLSNSDIYPHFNVSRCPTFRLEHSTTDFIRARLFAMTLSVLLWRGVRRSGEGRCCSGFG